MLRAVDCKFAVRGGGHAPFAGANNINDGITIDLSSLSSVVLTKKDTELQIGGGAHWGQVYPVTDAKGLTVIGGRSSGVGVGGLTTGGGISYFSARYGWACDNVNNYQVVFADGTIRNVNQASYPDVFRALRGGGNNFGIVTRFDLATFPHGKMWGGMSQSLDSSKDALLSALVSLNERQAEDPDCAAIVSYLYYSSMKLWLMNLNLENRAPVANPAALKNFTDAPTISSSLRTTTLANLTDELEASQPAGDRQSFFTLTVRNDAAVLATLCALFREEVEAVATTSVPSIFPSLSFQAISTATMSHFAKAGGNSLGLSPADGPLILLTIGLTWAGAAADAAMDVMAKNFVRRGAAAAKAAGADHPFLYLNYADVSQDVFEGYGAVSKAQLLATHQKWDSKNVFTELQPGGHKLL